MNSSIRERLQNAIKWQRAGKLEKAEAEYRKILKAHPQDTSALHFLGVLQHQKGQSDRAIRLIRRALKYNPGYLDAQRNLGNIYMEAGDIEQAETCYLQALDLQPADPPTLSNLCALFLHAGRAGEAVEAGTRCVHYDREFSTGWYQLGRALAADGKAKRAAAAFERALAINPYFFEAHSGLCNTLYQLEKSGVVVDDVLEKRREVCRRWVEKDPDNGLAQFMLASCDPARAPPRAPDEFVIKLFDRFSSSFDQKLALLDYRVPDHVRGVVEALDIRPSSSRTLDAGCGTGLCAAFLKPVSKRLIGVDLSAGMLERARRLGLYDGLVKAELTAYLDGQYQAYDLVICADTLCYFGNLDTVVCAAHQAMSPGGRFIFSVELLSGGEAPWKLNTSGRYAHTRNYVDHCLAQAGFSSVEYQQAELRKEGGGPVIGLVVVAYKGH